MRRIVVVLSIASLAALGLGFAPVARAADERGERIDELREKVAVLDREAKRAREEGREAEARELAEKAERVEAELRGIVREGPREGPREGGEPEARERRIMELKDVIRDHERALEKAKREGREGEAREIAQKLERLHREIADVREGPRGREGEPRERPRPERPEIDRRMEELEGAIREHKEALERAAREGRHDEAERIEEKVRNLIRQRDEIARGVRPDAPRPAIQGRIAELERKLQIARREGNEGAQREIVGELERLRREMGPGRQPQPGREGPPREEMRPERPEGGPPPVEALREELRAMREELARIREILEQIRDRMPRE